MSTTPRELRAAIARDLTPTRPLPRPALRALKLLPLAIAIVVLVPELNFFRSDLRTLGFLHAWGFSLAEAAAGLTVLALALRESIPGRTLSGPMVLFTIVAGLVLPFALLGLTAEVLTIGPPAGRAWTDGVICFRTSALAALPAVIASGVLAARAFPLRPVIAGALYGLGSGLIADAGLRLFCEYSVPAHVLLAHGGALVTALLAGALLAVLVERLRP